MPPKSRSKKKDQYKSYRERRKSRRQSGRDAEAGNRRHGRRPKKTISETSRTSIAHEAITRSRKKGRPVKLIALVTVLLAVVGGVGTGIYFGVVPTSTLIGESTPAILITTTTTPADVSTENPDLESPFDDETWIQIRGDCGRPINRPDLARIVGGAEAVKHSWPWQVGLLKYQQYDSETTSVKAICGGSLVGPKFVITATHCFLNSVRNRLSTISNEFRVLVGGHEKGKEADGAKVLEIESVHHHPANNLATFSQLRQLPIHDITVLKLKIGVDPTNASPMTTFVCLPKPYEIPQAKKRCWATGWGRTQGTGFDQQLKQVPQPIASEYDCKKKYGSSGIFKEKHLCAGPHKGSEGTCQGDSGGPLVCQYDDGAWVLHGATSFGPQPCGISPGVWTQVSYHLDWVCCILVDYALCAEVRCAFATSQ